MLKVLFFASLRERLECAMCEVALPGNGTVAALREQLCSDGGPVWQEFLGADNVVCAVNQTVCDDDQALQDGDEVAFYPPVTGG